MSSKNLHNMAMMPDPLTQPEAESTRRGILDLLKQRGCADVRTMAQAFGLSGMAIRLHLHALHEEGLIAEQSRRGGVGRPAVVWGLTRSADRFFPDAHAQLTVSLIGSMSQAFGRRGMDKLLKTRAEEQAAEYRAALPKKAGLRRRVEALAALRTAEGYMAEVEEDGESGLLLIENHCPICEAASACQGLCAMEQEVFESVLGENVSVDRVEHLQAGARRCVYRVRRVRAKD